MNKVKIEQAIWLMIAALFTGIMLFFMQDSTVATSIAVTFTSVVGVFIGVDLTVMLNKTAHLPAGEYKSINKHRYIFAMTIFSLLLIESFFIASTGRTCDGLYASFGIGFLVVIGGLVAGVEGNKLMTDKNTEGQR